MNANDSNLAAPTVANPEPLVLYAVELPWRAGYPQEGTYSAYFWAHSEEEAIGMCEEEMGRKCLDESEAKVDVVKDTILGWSSELFSGPNAWTAEAEQDYKELARLVNKYVALHGQPATAQAAPTPQLALT